MTREEAKQVIYQIINSGIISSELEDKLTEVCEHICADDFEACDGTLYCEGCKSRKH